MTPQRSHFHKPGLLWLYGLPGSGKTTLAFGVHDQLQAAGVPAFVLDGDCLRGRLNRDLGFSPEDRHENIRRAAEVGRLMVEAGLVVIAAFITPYEKSRQLARQTLAGLPYHECFVMCSVGECMRRDPKGLYNLAREGRLDDLTGFGAPFEEPQSPDLTIRTDQAGVAECVAAIMTFLRGQGLAPTA